MIPVLVCANLVISGGAYFTKAEMRGLTIISAAATAKMSLSALKCYNKRACDGFLCASKMNSIWNGIVLELAFRSRVVAYRPQLFSTVVGSSLYASMPAAIKFAASKSKNCCFLRLNYAFSFISALFRAEKSQKMVEI